MNNMQKLMFGHGLIYLIAAVSLSVAHADDSDEYNYIGAKAGQYNPKASDTTNIDTAISYGVYGGYKLTPNLGVEGEYLTTSDEQINTQMAKKFQYNADIVGLYGTYDHRFTELGLYAKGRLGFAQNKLNIDDINKVMSADSETLTGSDTGVAGSVGFGLQVSPLASIEAMYNVYPSIDMGDGTDLNTDGITIGAHLKF